MAGDVMFHILTSYLTRAVVPSGTAICSRCLGDILALKFLCDAVTPLYSRDDQTEGGRADESSDSASSTSVVGTHSRNVTDRCAVSVRHKHRK